MAKNIRISEGLYALAQAEAKVHDRSIAQQIEHWAKLGFAMAQQIEHWAKLGFAMAQQSDARGMAVEAAKRKSFALDRMAIESGQAQPGDFDFLGDAFVKGATFHFPVEFTRTAKP